MPSKTRLSENRIRPRFLASDAHGRKYSGLATPAFRRMTNRRWRCRTEQYRSMPPGAAGRFRCRWELNSGAVRREGSQKVLEAARRPEIDLVLVWPTGPLGPVGNGSVGDPPGTGASWQGSSR